MCIHELTAKYPVVCWSSVKFPTNGCLKTKAAMLSKVSASMKLSCGADECGGGRIKEVPWRQTCHRQRVYVWARRKKIIYNLVLTEFVIAATAIEPTLLPATLASSVGSNGECVGNTRK